MRKTLALTILLVSLLFLLTISAFAFEGLCPETTQEASEEFNVPENRLTRDPVGGCGWQILLGTPIDGVIVPRYYRADTSIGTFFGPDVIDGINVTTLWLVGAPYPEPELTISQDPTDPEVLDMIDFTLVGEHPDFITEYRWDFDEPGEVYTFPAGSRNAFHRYGSPGIYTVTIELMNEYSEPVYTQTKSVTVTEDSLVYKTYIPLVMSNSQGQTEDEFVPLLSEGLDYCPDNPADLFGGLPKPEGGLVGSASDWVTGSTCSFNPAHPGQTYWITLQPGSELHTPGGIITEPGHYLVDTDFTIWIPYWWGG